MSGTRQKEYGRLGRKEDRLDEFTVFLYQQETRPLEDDKEYVDSIKDAAHWVPPEHIRELFVTLLSKKELTTHLTVWLQTWHLLSQDVQYKRRHILNIPDLIINDDKKKNVCLFYMEELLRSRGCSLRSWPEMPYPDSRYIIEFGN
ncbi:hypothetical protein Tco_0229807, partial [Tanacetum coccineum]